MQRLAPDHNTISNFRKEHADSIRKVFKATVEIAKHFKLIGGKLIAGDSTKLRAQNSKKNNFNRNKIERHLNYIDQKLQHYNDELAEADGMKKRKRLNLRSTSKRSVRRTTTLLVRPWSKAEKIKFLFLTLTANR